MNPIKFVVCVCLTLLLEACGEPTIDTSSDAATKASIQEVRSSLPEAKRAEFDKALRVVGFSKINMRDLIAAGASGASGSGMVESKLKQSLNGKTGEQVIAEADRILAAREAKKRKQALAEIEELEKKEAAAEHAKEALKRFKVLASHFSANDNDFVEMPVIKLKVQNNTTKPVARAYFKGIIASPNRSVPWFEGSFNYNVSGGIEPGETQTWEILFGQYSGWGTVDAPADAVLTVSVTQIDDANGNPIYSTEGFSKRDQKRLEELKNNYGVK